MWPGGNNRHKQNQIGTDEIKNLIGGNSEINKKLLFDHTYECTCICAWPETLQEVRARREVLTSAASMWDLFWQSDQSMVPELLLLYWLCLTTLLLAMTIEMFDSKMNQQFLYLLISLLTQKASTLLDNISSNSFDRLWRSSYHWIASVLLLGIAIYIIQ